MQWVIHIHNSQTTNPFWPCLLLNLSPISGRRVCLCRILIRKALHGSEKMINEESLLVVFTVIYHLSVVCQKATFNYYFFSYVSAFLACNYSFFYSLFFNSYTLLSSIMCFLLICFWIIFTYINFVIFCWGPSFVCNVGILNKDFLMILLYWISHLFGIWCYQYSFDVNIFWAFIPVDKEIWRQWCLV